MFYRPSEKLDAGYTSGWMLNLSNRSDAAKNSSICALIFNFEKSVHDGVGALLTFAEVNTLFQKVIVLFRTNFKLGF